MTSRRDLFKFAGGSAAGILFTPAPWRLITDTALWSENWPGIPAPPRGEIRARFTNCSLCPAGCAVHARCAGDQPVQLTGVPAHPLSHGALCPLGVTGHHLPYHPARLRQGPVKEAAAAAAEAIARCGSGECVAVLDLRPGRTASWTYRRAMAAAKNGVYVAPSRTLGGAVAVNLAKARTVLSFGAPLLDGWGTPGNVIAERAHFRLIQAEPVESRTAVLADQWLPIRPGSEDELARAIASVLGGNRPTAAAGLPESQIADLAHQLASNGPALVLDAQDSAAVLSLNVLLGALGHTIVARRQAPVPESWKKAVAPTDLAVVPDGSVRVLFIDESAPGEYLPWNTVERKLVRDNPVVVAFAWSRTGYARHAQYVLPAAVYPEVADDIPPAVDAPVAAFRLAVPLLEAPAGVVKPADFIAEAVGLTGGDPLRERADAIQKAGRGTVFTPADGKSALVKEMKADDFWKALNEGACWMDAPDEKAAAPHLVPNQPVAGFPDASLPLVAVLTEQRASAAPVSPLMSKVYQESNLRLAPNRAALHPDMARECGVADGARAMLHSSIGRCEIEVTVDADIPRGAVVVAARPGVLDVCAQGARVKVVRA